MMVAQTLWVGSLHEVKPKPRKQCTSGIPSFISFQLFLTQFTKINVQIKDLAQLEMA